MARWAGGRKWLWQIVRLGVCVTALGWVLAQLNWEQFGEAWQSSDKFLVVTAFAFFLPAPTQVINKAIHMTTDRDAVLLTDIRISATRVLTGFLLSVFVGVPAGLILGMNPVIRAAINPIISIITKKCSVEKNCG